MDDGGWRREGEVDWGRGREAMRALLWSDKRSGAAKFLGAAGAMLGAALSTPWGGLWWIAAASLAGAVAGLIVEGVARGRVAARALDVLAREGQAWERSARSLRLDDPRHRLLSKIYEMDQQRRDQGAHPSRKGLLDLLTPTLPWLELQALMSSRRQERPRGASMQWIDQALWGWALRGSQGVCVLELDADMGQAERDELALSLYPALGARRLAQELAAQCALAPARPSKRL